MSERVYLAILGVVFFVSLVVFLGLVFLTNPRTSGALGISLFYLTFGLLIFSVATFGEIGWHFWRQKQQISGFLNFVSFRLNAVIVIFIFSLLVLAQNSNLSWMSAGAVLALLSIFEIWTRKHFKKK